jgi:hypothetical protein
MSSLLNSGVVNNMVTAVKPKLQLEAFVWGVPGKNISCINKAGKRVVFSCLQTARDYATQNGYSGIKVKFR